MQIVRCISCDGYGWIEDEEADGATDCDWCGGVGYVYRVGRVDQKIPEADYGRVADVLERLEADRLRELGYTGSARKPWEQPVRAGTQGGINPYEVTAEPQEVQDDGPAD